MNIWSQFGLKVKRIFVKHKATIPFFKLKNKNRTGENYQDQGVAVTNSKITFQHGHWKSGRKHCTIAVWK